MQPLRYTFTAMGSPCELLLCADSRALAQTAADAAMAEVGRIERKYSRYREEGIVSAINRAAGSGKPVECDAETTWLLNFADTLYTRSNGLFDITSGVLRRVWDFKAGRVPTEQEVTAILPLIDWRKVERSERHVCLPQAGMELDFGGFGKEYAADAAAATLRRHGVRSGYVNLGGDICVIGPQANGGAWQIAIQDPRQAGAVVASIPIQQGGLATSGDYEKFFEADGKRYCHILNPRTGMPVTYWRSISVAAPMAIVAGSCSTIAMLMEEEGRDWLRDSGFSYLGISGDGVQVSN